MGDLLEEIKSGDRRRALVAMRDELAAHMSAAGPNVVAQIAARLQAVLTELAGMPEEKSSAKGAPPTADEVRRQREKRRSTTAARKSAG